MIDEAIRYTIETFTPESARTFYDERRFMGNRHIRPGRVELLAAKLRSGRYKDNGMPSVAVAKDGAMRNGHHTLLAVEAAAVTVKLRTVWDIPDDAYDTFDTGAARSQADLLGAHYLNAETLVALLRPLIRWDRGIRTGSLFVSDTASSAGGKLTLQPADYEDYMAVNGNDVRAAERFARANKGKIAVPSAIRGKPNTSRAMFNPTALGIAHYLLRPTAEGWGFLEAVTSGAGLEPERPAFTVRDWFIRANPRGLDALVGILYAYRKHVEGAPLKTVDPSKFAGNPKLWDPTV